MNGEWAYSFVAVAMPAFRTFSAASWPRGLKASELGPGQLGEK